MIDAGSLAYGNAKTTRFMDRGDDEDWLGVQLVGCHHERISKSVDILNQHNFDVLDFNLGCPVPKVAKKGAGAALGVKIDEAVKCFEIIEKLSQHPVTAKIRILDEQDPAPTLRLIKGLSEAGAQAITIHGRVKNKFYAGPVYFDIIAAAREATNIQIIANGGITSISTYDEIIEKTGCDTVMLARGAMGNPWLFRELSDNSYIPPTPEELCKELEQHVVEMIDYYGETLALRIGRKVILDYLKSRGFPGKFKAQVSFLHTSEDFTEFIKIIREGPSGRYHQWLKVYPEADRRLLLT
jgi:tRNA-dihydrouridine synthase B